MSVTRDRRDFVLDDVLQAASNRSVAKRVGTVDGRNRAEVSELEAGPTAESEGSLIAESEDGLMAESEGSLIAESEDGLMAESEGSLIAESEDGLMAESEDGLMAELKGDLFVESDRELNHSGRHDTHSIPIPGTPSSSTISQNRSPTSRSQASRTIVDGSGASPVFTFHKI